MQDLLDSVDDFSGEDSQHATTDVCDGAGRQPEGATDPPPELVAELDAIPVVDVATELGLDPQSSGSGVYIRCPANEHEHDTESPACVLGGKRNLVTCFKCNFSATNTRLVQVVLDVGLVEACRWLQERFPTSCSAAGVELDPLARLAKIRGWTVEAMASVGASVGTHKGSLVVRVPMRDSAGKETGEKYRKPDNSLFDTGKKAHTKSRSVNTLFHPMPFPETGTILVVEGEADTFAAVSAGWKAVIGTPGAKPGRTSEQELQRMIAGRDVVFAPDSGSAGQAWLDRLGRLAENACCTVKFIPAAARDLDERLRFEEDKVAVLEALVRDAAPWSDAANDLPPAEQLTRLCEKEVDEFLLDQFGEPYVCIPTNRHVELWPTSSSRFQRWLARLYREKYGRPPGREALGQARVQVEAWCGDVDRRELYNRVAPYEDKIIYDLGTAAWKGIEISRDGWRIVPLPPVFRRYKHQVAQVTPERGGDPRKLFDFCHIADADQCLFVVTVTSYVVADIPHPVLIIGGEQDAGKSTTTRHIKSVIDPSCVTVSSKPKDEAAAQQLFDHHWVAVLDNLSGMPVWLSDCICRAVTGEGDAKRSLYTDDEDFLRAFRRCIVVNGIDIGASRPDLLDRAVMIEAKPLLPSERKTEKEMEEAWQQALPGILGGLLDAVSRAMKDLGPTPSGFRMADFARWGIALAPALGYSADKFVAAYQASVQAKWEFAADNDTLAAAVRAFVARCNGYWKGTPADLLRALTMGYGNDLTGRYTDSKTLPRSPGGLSAKLKRMAPALRQVGLSVEWLRSNGVRLLELKSTDGTSGQEATKKSVTG